MLKASVYNFHGEMVGEKELDKEIFEFPIKPEIVQEAIVAQMANARKVIAHTKDRSEVRGGGRKPWKQKGTGRARHGSIRSPLWIGGGVTFGPNADRNFSKKINKKVRKAALKMALTDKAQDSKIYLIEDAIIPEKKTKSAFTLLKNLKLKKAPQKIDVKESKKEKEPKILIVLPKEKSEIARYFRNIHKVSVISIESLNVVDVVKHQCMVMPVHALESISRIYNNKHLTPDI